MKSATPCVLLISLLALVGSWRDCDKLPPEASGPYPTNLDKAHVFQSHTIYLQYPTSPSPANGSWPAVVFMHGLTLGWEWYERHIAQWSSHGFVIVFPFVKSVERDDGIIPVTETDARSIYVALEFLRLLAAGSIPSPQDMKGTINMSNIGLVGHSMGGEDTIRAAAGVRIPGNMTAIPEGSLRVAIAQHPSLCTFPPPYPYTINKAEINSASKRAALLLFTAENDRAFLPGTPNTEYTCWQAARGEALFASFKKDVCETYPPCKSMSGASGCTLKIAAVGSGHMCACDAPGLDTWTSPELKWVTAALRLYLHHDGVKSTACGAQVWGSGRGSFSTDPNIASIEMHERLSRDAAENSVVV